MVVAESNAEGFRSIITRTGGEDWECSMLGTVRFVRDHVRSRAGFRGVTVLSPVPVVHSLTLRYHTHLPGEPRFPRQIGVKG